MQLNINEKLGEIEDFEPTFKSFDKLQVEIIYFLGFEIFLKEVERNFEGK